MKNSKHVLFIFAFLLSAIFSKAQTPNTCTAAISKSYPLTTFTVTSYSDSTYWFTMSLSAGDYDMNILNQSSTGKIGFAGAYIGTCGSQTLIASSQFGQADSTQWNLRFSLSSSTIVYFKLNNTGTNSSFIVSAVPLCLAYGNIGFCSGQTVTLTCQTFNYVGTPTYTWMPGGFTSTLITITPSVSQIYTLTSSSGSGICTHTFEVFPLPSQFCNSCDYVYNGSFESWGPNSYYGVNACWNWSDPSMSTFSATSPPTSAAGYCTASNYAGSTSGGVPTNFYHSNLPAKTGRAYIHCRTHGFPGPSPYSVDQRHYAEQMLRAPLATGQTYSVGFYIASSDYCTMDKSANFGAYLSTSTLVLPTSSYGYVFPTTYTPQVICTTTAIPCYTWIPISGTVTGAGQQYLTLGNFYNDAATPSYSNPCAPWCTSGVNNTVAMIYMDDITITPLPATLTVSNPTITNCSQTTVTLSANGAAPAYTSWTDGINTYTGAVVVVPVPTFPTTYTCSVNLPTIGSCNLGGTVTVYNACTACSTPTNVLPSTLTSTILSTTFFAMNNNLTIYGNVTFDKCEVQIIKTASITVTPGATLNILGSHLYACGDMWQGIDVQPGGVINLNTSGPKSAFVEDAVVAVNIAGGSTLTTNILTSISTSYNRNKTSINIAGYFPQISPYPFTIYGNLFTSRTITFTAGSIVWPHTNSIKAATQPTTSPLETPYINNTTYVPTNLKAPYSTVRPDVGIYLENVGTTINASTTPTYYGINIGIGSGTNTYNIFDNMYRCIQTNDANISCINGIYQNVLTYGRGGGFGGIGIDANAAAAAYRIRVKGQTSATYINKFFNCCRAINTNNYFEHEITDCDVRSTITSYTLPYTLNNIPGAIGFNMVTSQYRVLNASGNHIYNIANGILFTADVNLYWNLLIGRYGGQVNIDNNEIRPHLPTYAVTTQFVASAISANDVMTSTSGYSVFTIPSTSISINSNTITDVWNGISQTNFGQQPVTAWNNTITLVNQPSSVGPPTQWGIQNNQLSNAWVYRNTITGPTTYTAGLIRGITTSMNSTLTVKCNTTNQLDRGIEFNSTQANTIFWDNTMSSHVYGSANDNAGIIGTQGSTTVPTDNQWPGTWTVPNYKTFTSSTASSATNSPLYIRYATGTYDPQGSGLTLGFLGIDEYHHTGSNDNLFNITGSPSARTCPSTPLCPTCRGVVQVEPIASNEPLMEQLASGKISYKKYNNESQYINKHIVFRQLASKPATKKQGSNSSDLNSFYNSNARTNINELNEIEIDLLSGDFNAVNTKLADFVPENAIENNYLNYYKGYLNSKQGNFTSTDSLNLTSLANGCPFTDGGVVYQARALYNVVFDTYRIFYDICYTDSTSERLISGNEEKAISVVKFSRVYPNPTAGLVNVVVTNAKDKEEVSAEVFDITGKSIYSSKQFLNSGTIILNPDLSSGTYLLKIKLSDGTMDVHRLIISK